MEERDRTTMCCVIKPSELTRNFRVHITKPPYLNFKLKSLNNGGQQSKYSLGVLKM